MLYKIILMLVLFLSLTGMRIILKDGNHIEVDSYYFYKDKVVIKLGNKVYEINEFFVDKDETGKLNYLEQKKINILKSYTSFYLQSIDKKDYYIKKIEKSDKKHSQKDTKIQLETRKEKSTFFSDETFKDENFLEKIQRKGIMIKIRVPVEEEKY